MLRPLHRTGDKGSMQEILLKTRKQPERVKESATKYEWWKLRKKYHDHAKKLLKKINVNRAMSEESWFLVGVALAAVDEIQGVGKDEDCPIKSLQSEFVNWTKKHHCFEDVKVSKKKYETFSLTMRDMMQKATPNTDDDEKDEELVEQYIIPAVKYAYPPPAIKGQQSKPLTKDEALKNKIVNNLCRTTWENCQKAVSATYIKRILQRLRRDHPDSFLTDDELQQKKEKESEGEESTKSKTKPKEKKVEGKAKTEDEIGESIDESMNETKAGDKESKSNANTNDESKTSKNRENEEEESKSNKKSFVRPPDQNDDDLFADCPTELQDEALGLRRWALEQVGTLRLSRWANKDESDLKEETKKQKLESKIQAKRRHLSWVDRKNKMRIRLPESKVGKQKNTFAPRRFDFSLGKPLNRPKHVQKATTTVDMLGGLGFKYVHAVGHRAEGNRDLLNSRKQVVKSGHVFKSNFIDEDGDHQASKFHEERQKNSKQSKKKANLEKRYRRRFNSWLEKKSNTDRAMEYLSAIPHPADMDSKEARLAEDLWQRVGKSLKAINQNLLLPWSEWSKDFRSPNICLAYWNSFDPVACDAHQVSSAVKTTFFKMFKKKQAEFIGAFERAYRQSHRKDDEEETIAVLDSQTAGITYTVFQKMLANLGMKVSLRELHRLSLCLDRKATGLITLSELVTFTDEKQDTASRLKKRCIWEQACSICGMPAGFAIRFKLLRDSSGKIIRDRMGYVMPIGSKAAKEYKKKKKKTRKSGIEEKSVNDSSESNYDSNEEGKSDDNEMNGDRLCDERFETEDHKRAVNSLKRVSHLHKMRANEDPPDICAAANWPPSPRVITDSLKYLKNNARNGLEERRGKAQNLLGGKPKAPTLNVIRLKTDSQEDLMGSLRIVYEPAPNSDPVAFFVLETCGAEGSRQQVLQKWKTICTDPDSAESKQQMSLEYFHNGLLPNTPYHYRIRAFNGHGASGYTHSVFCTAPRSPPPPVLIQATALVLVVDWSTALARHFANHKKQLAKLWDDIDKDRSGMVSRDELLEAVKNNEMLQHFLNHAPASQTMIRNSMSLHMRLRVEDTADLRRSVDGFEDDELNKSVASTIGNSTFTQTPKMSVFDCIAQNDDEELTWEEFESFFAGKGDEPPPQTEAHAAKGTKYVLQRCAHAPPEDVEQWTDVYLGTETRFTMNGMPSGRRFKFRVIGVNRDGVESQPSKELIAATLLRAPPPPQLAGKGETAIASTAVKLRLGKLSRIGGTEDEVDNILKLWAMPRKELVAQKEAGVSVRALFDRFDIDGSGSIDAVEMKPLLALLAAPCEDWNVQQALKVMDTNKNGIVSFLEFKEWFESEETVFVVKRDDGMPGKQLQALLKGRTNNSNVKKRRSVKTSPLMKTRKRASSSSKSKLALRRRNSETGNTSLDTLESILPPPVNGMQHVAYRGTNRVILYRGLQPNTAYRFAVRIISRQTSSALSQPLTVMTPPKSLPRPVQIATAERWARIRLYTTKTGASHYTIQVCTRGLRGSEKPPKAVGARAKAASQNLSGWQIIWQGSGPIAHVVSLAPAKRYKVRVVAYNMRGGTSEPSPVTEISTVKRGEYVELTPNNASQLFRVECTGDVVIGDTILFTEQLFEKSIQNKSSDSNRGFLGERTVAAVVTNEKWEDFGDGTQKRSILMEVQWCTVSKRDIVSHVLQDGAFIWRDESEIFKYETFRLKWDDEASRIPFANEYSERFVISDETKEIAK